MSDPPDTPNKPTSSLPKQTPISMGSSTPSGSDVASAVVSQSTQIELMEDELDGAIHNSRKDWFDILTHFVAEHELDKLSSVYEPQLLDYEWPPQGALENQLYKPTAKWLNKIATTIRSTLPRKQSYCSWDLWFFTYDRKTEHQTNVELKPDLLGWLNDVTQIPSGQYVDWSDVHILVEVKKKKLSELIYQTSTYARAMFSHQNDRLWIYAILITGHATAAFARFDRSGVVTTHDISINLLKGRRDFVKGVLAIMQLQQLEFGIDTSVSGNQIAVLDNVYDVKEVLCYRECVRGRSTRAYRMGCIEKPEPPAVLEPLIPPGAPVLQTGPMRRKSPRNHDEKEVDKRLKAERKVHSEPRPSVLRQTMSGRIASSSKSAQSQTESKGKTRRPAKSKANTYRIDRTLRPVEKVQCLELIRSSLRGISEFILKESWPIMTKANDLGREGTVVDAIKKLKTKIFGLPDFGPRYIPMRDANSKYETSYLNILNLTDIRACVRQVILTVGKPLHTASGPRQLVIALRDALSGLRNLFRLGYVHRDVSSGNTYITEPEQRFHILPGGKPDSISQSSTGMAGDFDLCISHSDEDRLTHSHRTGTLPFMAVELLINLEPPYHSPVHDMESVMWVLLWVVCHKNVDVAGDKPNRQDVKLCDDLSVANLTMALVARGKRSVISELLDVDMPPGSNLEPFRNLLVKGFELVRFYIKQSRNLSAAQKTFSDDDIEKAFAAYLDVFEQNIPVETDWSHVKGGP